MPLDPQIVARYWLVNWDSSTSDHEKELNSWVDVWELVLKCRSTDAWADART